MNTLRIFDAQGQLGTMTLENGKLTGSNRGMQEMANSAVRSAGGDPEKAFSALNGWSNGYIWAKP